MEYSMDDEIIFMGESKHLKEAKINVDLWHSTNWSQKELQEFIDLFQEFEPTTGQISSDERGLEIQITIAVISSAIIAGFFNRLGSDLYEFSKAKLKSLLLKQSSNHDITAPAPEVEGRLSFTYYESEMNLKVFYTGLYSIESELDTFLSSLHFMDNLIRGACRTQLFPFDKGRSYDVKAFLEISKYPTWSVRILRNIKKDEHLGFKESFQAQFNIKELKSSNWERIEWIRT